MVQIDGGTADGGLNPGGQNQSEPVSFTIDVVTAADLTISKTADAEFYQPGQMMTYTMTATNPGLSDAPGTQVSDPLAAGLELASWTCVGADGGSCPAGGSGLLDAAVDLPEGASVTFTLTAVVADGFSDT